MYTIDLSLFYTIFNLSGHSVWLDWLIILVGEYLLYLLLLVVAYCIYQDFRACHPRKVYDYCIALTAALIARFGVAEVIRLFYHRPRPYLALHLPHLLSDTAYSFPSGHTIFLFALATSMLFVNKKLARWLYVAGIAIGLARVAAGVHYPSDIIGGMILGILTGYLVHQSWVYLSRRINFPLYE